MLATERRSCTVTVLTENTAVDGLAYEHGLSLFLQYGSAQILLDFGQSDAFARNADTLGIDLATVDYAVLSHAHYDHADGMEAFFGRNEQAPLYLSDACQESCWSTKGGTAESHYIGIKPGLLERYQARLRRVPTDRTTTIMPGVHLVPHTTRGLEKKGKQAGMLLREGERWLPDGFAHEMSLVVELASATDGTPRLAVFNSCSHAGVNVIAQEVLGAFPDAGIASYVGGLHLMHADDDEIVETAQAIGDAHIRCVYTGHCTSTHAVSMLSQMLPNGIRALYPGMSFAL